MGIVVIGWKIWFGVDDQRCGADILYILHMYVVYIDQEWGLSSLGWLDSKHTSSVLVDSM